MPRFHYRIETPHTYHHGTKTNIRRTRYYIGYLRVPHKVYYWYLTHG